MAGGVAAAALFAAAAAAGAVLPVVLSPVAAHADGSFDSAMLSLLNQDRSSHGVPPLQSSASLGGIAESTPYGGCGYGVAGRAEDMLQRNYLSHQILDCGSQTVYDMLRADNVGFSQAGEIIGYASGITDPSAAASYINQKFMSDSEHSSIILDPSFTVAGVGSWWTASGQTWSGAGSAQSQVVVTAVDFIQPPPGSSGGGAPAPVVHQAAPPHTGTATQRQPAVTGAGARAARPTPLQLAVARPPHTDAAPQTGVLGEAPAQDGDQLAGASPAQAGAVVHRVPALTGTSLALTGAGAAGLAGLSAARRVGARRRRRRTPSSTG
jgi:uncharacterized protein YkwD